MSLSSLLSTFGTAVVALCLAATTLLVTGPTATADCGPLPVGHYCGDGHPWHN